MAHFAEIDTNNEVIRVIVADSIEWCENNLGGIWIQTSYNTFAGKHNLGGIPLHKNYAGVGYLWDGIGFYEKQPYPSWTLNSDTYLWESPVLMPTDGKRYRWNEDEQEWQLLGN